MKSKRLFGLLVAVAALGIMYAGCDLFEGSGGASTAYEPLVIRGKAISGDDFEIIITRAAPGAVLKPMDGDNYLLRVNGTEYSRGTIVFTESRIIFYPTGGGMPFAATYSSAGFEDIVVSLFEPYTEEGSVVEPSAPSTPVWAVEVFTTIVDGSWGSIHRSQASEITENSRAFTQADLNSWNGGPSTPATAPVTRYVRVFGKKLGVDFDRIELKVNNIELATKAGTINSTDLTSDGGSWANIDGDDTRFKHALAFATKDPTTSKWTVTRSGARLDFNFYLGYKLVGTAYGGTLPTITVSSP